MYPDLKWPCIFDISRTWACTWISHCAKSLPLAAPSATNCNQQVHAKAMTRHYRDHHQEKIKPTKTHWEMVRGFANFGSGRGECPLCCTRTLNVHTHQCSVVYQLAAMTAHVFDPAHFPVMPCMKRAWYPSSTSGTDQVPDEAPDPGPTIKKLRGPMDLTSTPDTALTTRSTAAPSSSDQANTSPSIYKCTQCPAVFLSPQGLTQHQEVHHTPGSIPAQRLGSPSEADLQVKIPSRPVWLRLQPPRFQSHCLSSPALCVLK